MLAAIYGCQVIIYVLHRRFEHIGQCETCILHQERPPANPEHAGWMLLYILAIPFFSFVLPLVSFWQMDDFSW